MTSIRLRKPILVSLLFLCLAFTLSAQKQLVIDPNAEMRAITGSFKIIVVSGGIDLYLSQGEEEAIAVSAADDRFKEDIKTVVENNILKIYYDGEKIFGNNKRLKAYISFKALFKIETSGGSDIFVVGEIHSTDLTLKCSGGSDFQGAIKVNTFNMDLSGGSDVSISGTATTTNIQNSGASDVNGYTLITDVCNARASGASDISITINKELNAHASGASNIFFKGEAEMKNVQSTGGSTIARKSD